VNNLKSKVNFKRLKDTIDKSAEIGNIPVNGLKRLALSDEDKLMRDIFQVWMEEAGLEVRIDDFGNMYGKRPGKTDKPPVLVGSHLDTQPSGGRFDGILGVLTALEVVRTLNDNDIETMRPIEIVNFTNEEGARFEPPMMASGGLAGVFDREFIYSRKDRDGKKFGDELKRIGYQGKSENRIQDIYAFLELHIEQGPVLENENISIGAVEGIQGTNWLEITVTGESDHAGPTPMNLRKDALTAASQMIGIIEERASGKGVMATVGRLSLSPNVTNCIPGQVVFSLDIRHFDDYLRKEVLNEITEAIQRIADDREITVRIEDLWDSKTTIFNPKIVNLIEERAKELGYNVKKMPSGAGHDSKHMNELAPTAMIFVPSANGKSHDVSELTLDEDIENGANVLYEVVYQLANNEGDLV